jgi:hypothetical protein
MQAIWLTAARSDYKIFQNKNHGKLAAIIFSRSLLIKRNKQVLKD